MNFMIIDASRYEQSRYPHNLVMMLDLVILKNEDGTYTPIKHRFDGDQIYTNRRLNHHVLKVMLREYEDLILSHTRIFP